MADASSKAGFCRQLCVLAKKNRILKNAMNERVMRLKRFNVFHENPAMVGVEDASVNAADQAHYYLNQAKEKREFE